MNCDICDKKYDLITASTQFFSKALGNILVPNISRMRCSGCGKELFDSVQSKMIREYVAAKEQDAISSLPIRDFVSLNEAAQMLGVTKQAFSKNSRIQRGFIYSLSKDGRKFYLKPSIEEFKRTGKDGRISLFYKQYEHHKSIPAIHFMSKLSSSVYDNKYSLIVRAISAVPDNYLLAGEKQKHKKYNHAC